MRVVDLVLDESLYPRRSVNLLWIGELVQHLRAGVTFPPVVVWNDGNQVLDGFHRTKAVERLKGPTGEIACEHFQCGTRAEAFLEACRLNADHGLPLNPVDMAHSIRMAVDRLHIPEDAIRRALAQPEGRFESLAARFAYTPAGDKIALRRTMDPEFRGKHLTQEQVQAMEHSGGWKASFHARSLTQILAGDLYVVEDYRLRDALRELQAAIERALGQWPERA